jgi:hypothetical protein
LGPTLPPDSIISMTWKEKTNQLFIILLQAQKSYIETFYIKIEMKSTSWQVSIEWFS